MGQPADDLATRRALTRAKRTAACDHPRMEADGARAVCPDCPATFDVRELWALIESEQGPF